MATSKSTRLDAVNTILRSAGEAPIANLTTQAGVGSVVAAQTLDETDRAVQTSGWTWNRRTTTFTRDVDNKIPIPETVVRIVKQRGTHYTIRGGFLYDMEEGSTEFTSDVEVTIVELLVWEDLPEVARHYITVKSARKYADRNVGDGQLSSYTRQDEAEAWQALRKDELASGKYTIFAPEDQAFVDRGSPLWGLD